MARAVVLLLVVVLGLFVSLSVAHLDERDYGIIIDAGSSGSRIYLYDWPHRDNNSLPTVEPTINQTVVSMKISIALNDFENAPSGAGYSLVPLIRYIQNELTPSKWGVTPIYLKATAGMRALNLTTQNLIMQSVRQYLSTTPFYFQPDNAKVIPGTDEGMFGWITTNYATYALQRADPAQTFGALDMGGASTQITFVPQVPPSQYGRNLQLAYVNYSLYTYSYPLGQDASLNVLLESLVYHNISDGKGNYVNPCYLAGYQEQYNGGENSTVTNATIVGTGNYAQCVKFIEAFITVKNPLCAHCGIGNVYQPALFGNYYAFSGFAYTFNFFGLGNTSNIAELQNATLEFCSLTWEKAVVEYSSVPPQYLKTYCKNGVYYADLLTRAYGFNVTGTNIIVQSIIGDIELTWALGGMIYEASLLPFGFYNGTWSFAT